MERREFYLISGLLSFYLNTSANSFIAAKSSSQDAESPGGMVSTGPIEHKVRIGKKEISVLEGHESDVFVCVWNPKYNLIATG